MPAMRRYISLIIIGVLGLGLLAGCGRNQNEPGGLEGQVMGMLSPSQQPILLPGAVIALTGPSGSQVATTDAQGRYQFPTLAPGNYGLSASYQGPLVTSPPLQAEERRFSVSPGLDETISMVLLAEGITPPPTPPSGPVPPVGGGSSVNSGGGGVSSGGLFSDPFFWYFVFNQPGHYGYSRPPIVLGSPGGSGSVVVSPEQPRRSGSGRPYTEYDDRGGVGRQTKPPPEVISKGSTRPGAGASNTGGGSTSAKPGGTGGNSPVVRPPSSSPPTGTDSSRGTTRPGSGPVVNPPSSQPPVVRPPSSNRSSGSSGGSRSSGGGKRR